LWSCCSLRWCRLLPKFTFCSKFLAENGPEIFSEKLKTTSFVKRKRVLKANHWRKIVLESFKLLYDQLSSFANDNGYEVKDLSCTIIVVAFAPWGLMSAHIGDGRAAFRGTSNNWVPFMTPFSGSEAGTTVFFSTPIVWNHEERFIETKVSNDIISGFSLLSDGMEKSSFECYTKAPDKEYYYDPNKPFNNFFNPIGETLINMSESKWDQKRINQEWRNFLLVGNERIRNEPDDKTMIIGVLKKSKSWQK